MAFTMDTIYQNEQGIAVLYPMCGQNIEASSLKEFKAKSRTLLASCTISNLNMLFLEFWEPLLGGWVDMSIRIVVSSLASQMKPLTNLVLWFFAKLLLHNH